MAKLLEQAIRAVRDLPEDEQDAAGAALLDHIAAMRDFQLTDEQLAEVRRRRSDPAHGHVSLAEAKEILRKRI